MKTKLMRSFSKPSLFVFILYGFATIVTIAAVIFCYIEEIPFGNLSRDPNAISDSNFYYGAISNLGVLFWSFSTAICLFTYSILKGNKCQIASKTNKDRNFLLWGGAISLMLLLDDVFLLHEIVFRVLFGLNEKTTFGIYGLFLLAYLVKYKELIRLRTPYLHLLLTFVLFALSLFFDFLPRFTEKWHHVFEDGPKFLGIVSWFAYQMMASKALYNDFLYKFDGHKVGR